MRVANLVKMALQNNRMTRVQRRIAQREAEDSRQQFLGSYAGSREGTDYVRLPGGGLMPVKLISNGAVELNQVVVGAIARGSGIGTARTMPR